MRIHWDPERSASLPAFIRLLADREIASLLRSRRRSPWGEEPTDADTLDDLAGPTAEPEARLGARQSLAALSQRARARLGSRGAELFELILLDELSTPQICARTGLSADAVYAWSSRIKRLLRDVSEEDSPLRTIAVRSIGARRVQRGGRGT